MRILVTGGSGFIGSNFLHHVLHAKAGLAADCCPDQSMFACRGSPGDVQVLNMDVLTYAARPENTAGLDRSSDYRFTQGDICDAGMVDTTFATFEPELVVHFAAESHVDRSITDGTVFTQTNVVGTQVLLDAARRHEVPHFLHVSTDEVYGSIDEGSFTEADPYRPSSPYAASKAASDLLVLAHHHTYGLPVTLTRCTNNYGPRQHPEKLVPKMAQNAFAGQRLPIYGDGLNVRDWLYVKDHAEALLHVAELPPCGEVFNVAGRCEKTNLEIVESILKGTGAATDLIEFVPDRPGHDRRYSLDDSKLRATGWRPRVDLENGMRRTLDWVDHHLESVA